MSAHLDAYRESGAELIMGRGHFVGAKTIEAALNGGGERLLAGSEESWPYKSGQQDKWSFCLRAVKMAAAQERR